MATEGPSWRRCMLGRTCGTWLVLHVADEKHALALPVQTALIKLLRPVHAGAIPIGLTSRSPAFNLV